MAAPRPVERFGPYEVMVAPGRSDRLLLSVASLGQPDGTVPFEWMQTLDCRGGAEHVLYIRDTRQSWYNTEAGWPELLHFLAAYQARHGIRWTAAFGVSAGAFGALLLAEHLPLQRVVALCPQSGIGGSAGFDQRYRAWWDRIGPMPRPEAGHAFLGRPEVACCYSVDAAEDVVHAECLAARNAAVARIPFRGAHNLAGEFRLRDLTEAFVEELVAERPDFGRLGAIPPHPAYAEAAPAYLALVRHEMAEEAWQGLVAGIPGPVLPAYAYHWASEMLADAAAAEHRRWEAVAAAAAWPAHRGRTAIAQQIGPYLARGWSAADAAGAWSVGRWHFLRAHLLDEPPGERCRVTLHLRVWVPAARPVQVVRYWQRGALLREVRYERRGADFLELKESFVLDGPVLELLVETPEALAPAAISGTNRDRRLLGVFLTRLGFG